jgi:alanyl-tRNA synthetase
MQYGKTGDGRYERLQQHNVDTGMGVERTVAMLQGKRSVFETELFEPILSALSDACGRRPDADAVTERAFRVIADHLRSSVFILGDERGVAPGNLGQGYVLRRLIRRAVRYGKQVGLPEGFMPAAASTVIETCRHAYPELDANRDRVLQELKDEESRFEKTLARGMAELDKVLARMKEHGQTTVSGRVAFNLYDTCGFPLEFTEEICAEQGMSVDRAGYEKAFAKHREVSRQGADKAFKGGLADNSAATMRLHTATHLLHRALRVVLGDHVQQKGSNITAKRLRFDFTHPEKVASDQLARVQEMVNEVIGRDLPVTMETMSVEQAREQGATALFAAKYGEQVKVYSVGDFSKEVCGGPHVGRTGELGRFRIIKEESSSAGVRRIRAVLDPADAAADA